MAEQIKTTFIDAEGESHRSPQPGIVAMHILHPDFDPIVVTRDDIHDDNQECAFWHGLKQKLGDKRAGKDAEEGYDETVALYERLCESANWNLAREGVGPRTSILAAAIVAVLVSAGRLDGGDSSVVNETISAKMELCKDKTYREKAASRPDVKAHMERIKAERAAERAAKAKKEAASVEVAEVDTL